MRVLQLIDTLDTGGAERMLVNWANTLHDRAIQVHVCTSRRAGSLSAGLHPEIPHLNLKRRHTLDLSALYKLVRYVRRHQIDLVHAHGASYFLAWMLKRFCPKVKLVWHEHHGKRANTKPSEHPWLIRCSKKFDHVFVVNQALLGWWTPLMPEGNVRVVQNFVMAQPLPKLEDRDHTIILLANLRAPKNHLNALTAFAQLADKHPDWSLLLVGTDHQDAYAKLLKNKIAELQLEDRVTVYGPTDDPKPLLSAAQIGLLSSDSEGLPMSLLEYGLSGLAVVCTDVGECAKVIGSHGTVVPAGDSYALATALDGYLSNAELRQHTARAFYERILANYTENSALIDILETYKTILSTG